MGAERPNLESSRVEKRERHLPRAPDAEQTDER